MFRALIASLALLAPINPDPATLITFTNCSASGSSAQALTGGAHLMTVTGEDTFVCVTDSASTCAAGGMNYPVGTVIHITFGNGSHSVSCRSPNAAGDVQFIKAPGG